MTQRNVILVGDALERLRTLPSESVHCLVSSPPYFGLRAYLDGDNPDKAMEIGLEETPEAYVEKLVVLFREARRVLRANGNFWLNLGDSYWANRSENGAIWNDGHLSKSHQARSGGKSHPVYKPKDLMMIPHRVAIALQMDGWYVRSDVCWSKSNPMPESVTDRPTKSKEYVFLLAKSESYWYDQDAIREPHTTKPGKLRDRNTEDYIQGAYDTPIGEGARTWYGEEGRNKRDVWTIPVKTYKKKGLQAEVAHYAVMPLELAETCIKAGCPETVCAACGAPYERLVESQSASAANPRDWQGVPTQQSNRAQAQMPKKLGAMGTPTRTYHGWRATCACNAGTAPGIVLDPFGGAGTTAVAARKLGRDYILIELSAQYAALAEERLRDQNPYASKKLKGGMVQPSLFKDEP